MASEIDKTKILEFVGETAPDNLQQMAGTIIAMIDLASSTYIRGLSDENRDVMTSVRHDLENVAFFRAFDMDRPRFGLTPQEIDWLHRHAQDLWLDYLIHRYKFKLYPVQQKLTDFPPHLLIEPTSICNLRCIMCFQSDKSFSSDRQFMGMMSWNLFCSVVDQAAESGCNAITLASRGEPTIHKKFGNMVAYLHEKKILDTKVNTNATRLSEKTAHDILAADISTVVFSVDASTKESYERIRVGGKFDQVLRNVERFNEIRQTDYPGSGTTTRISGVAVEGTQDPEEMREFWSNYVDQVTIGQEMPLADSYARVPVASSSVCRRLYESLYVWFDGVCNPCDFDYKSLLSPGNAKEQSITDIWLGKKFSRLRELHEARMRASLVPCDRCPL